LDLLEHFLNAQGTNWIPFVDYYRMDGETSVENREQLCTNFNNNPAAKLFLLTHRVGGLGLNLTGANRVVFLGSNHNPRHHTPSN
jgi:SNF2 family DNA or RNA helicase